MRVFGDAYRLLDSPYDRTPDPWKDENAIGSTNRVLRFAKALWGDANAKRNVAGVLTQLSSAGHRDGLLSTASLRVRLASPDDDFWRCGKCARVHLHKGAEICTRCLTRLVVDDGAEREVAFDADARTRAKRVLKELLEGMPPPAGPSTASELAVPGKGCWGCQVRHVCPAYLAAAPQWWQQYPDGVERLSNDVWGTVLDVIGEGRVDVVLRDASGRRVRIDGLDPRHGLTSVLVGKSVWFFGLEATGATRGFDGGRFHPRSFHALPRDRMERRAWAFHVFGEKETAGGA